MNYKKSLIVNGMDGVYTVDLSYSRYNYEVSLQYYSRKDSAIKGAYRLAKYFENAEVVINC